jgi:hypothetical protein
LNRYSKVYVPEAAGLMRFQKLALLEYEKILSFADRMKVKGFDAELAMCRQMVELLPAKLARIAASGQALR